MPATTAKRACWVACLWPGLAPLWLRGSWPGLGVAIAFTGTVNGLLLATFLWTEWIGETWLTAGWIAALVVWAGSALISWRWCSRRRAFEEEGPPQDLFPRALGEYLRGNWYEVETLCRTMLRAEGRDVEAQLLLASTLRHAGRRDEARRRLDELRKLEAAAKWELEIENEIARLADAGDVEAGLTAAGDEQGAGDEQADDPKLLGAA